MVDTIPFWIRFYDLPIDAISRKVTEAIENAYGGFQEIDKDSFFLCALFIRLRILVNILKPIRRGLLMKINGRRIWVEIKYERLSNFCYSYRIVGHVEID